MPGHEEVLRVVQVRVEAVLDAADHTRLQVYQQRARDVMLVIGLVEKDIFAVVTLGRVLLKDALSADAVLVTQLLPKLVANFTHREQQRLRVSK